MWARRNVRHAHVGPLHLETPVYDWQKLTVEALSLLGADEIIAPGAKLHAQMVKLGYPDGFDVADHVAGSGYSFSKLVERVFEKRLWRGDYLRIGHPLRRRPSRGASSIGQNKTTWRRATIGSRGRKSSTHLTALWSALSHT